MHCLGSLLYLCSVLRLPWTAYPNLIEGDHRKGHKTTDLAITNAVHGGVTPLSSSKNVTHFERRSPILPNAGNTTGSALLEAEDQEVYKNGSVIIRRATLKGDNSTVDSDIATRCLGKLAFFSCKDDSLQVKVFNLQEREDSSKFCFSLATFFQKDYPCFEARPTTEGIPFKFMQGEVVVVESTIMPETTWMDRCYRLNLKSGKIEACMRWKNLKWTKSKFSGCLHVQLKYYVKPKQYVKIHCVDFKRRDPVVNASASEEVKAKTKVTRTQRVNGNGGKKYVKNQPISSIKHSINEPKFQGRDGNRLKNTSTYGQHSNSERVNGPTQSSWKPPSQFQSPSKLVPKSPIVPQVRTKPKPLTAQSLPIEGVITTFETKSTKEKLQGKPQFHDQKLKPKIPEKTQSTAVVNKSDKGKIQSNKYSSLSWIPMRFSKPRSDINKPIEQSETVQSPPEPGTVGRQNSQKTSAAEKTSRTPEEPNKYSPPPIISPGVTQTTAKAAGSPGNDQPRVLEGLSNFAEKSPNITPPPVVASRTPIEKEEPSPLNFDLPSSTPGKISNSEKIPSLQLPPTPEEVSSLGGNPPASSVQPQPPSSFGVISPSKTPLAQNTMLDNGEHPQSASSFPKSETFRGERPSPSSAPGHQPLTQTNGYGQVEPQQSTMITSLPTSHQNRGISIGEQSRAKIRPDNLPTTPKARYNNGETSESRTTAAVPTYTNRGHSIGGYLQPMGLPAHRPYNPQEILFNGLYPKPILPNPPPLFPLGEHMSAGITSGHPLSTIHEGHNNRENPHSRIVPNLPSSYQMSPSLEEHLLQGTLTERYSGEIPESRITPDPHSSYPNRGTSFGEHPSLHYRADHSPPTQNKRYNGGNPQTRFTPGSPSILPTRETSFGVHPSANYGQDQTTPKPIRNEWNFGRNPPANIPKQQPPTQREGWPLRRYPPSTVIPAHLPPTPNDRRTFGDYHFSNNPPFANRQWPSRSHSSSNLFTAQLPSNHDSWWPNSEYNSRDAIPYLFRQERYESNSFNAHAPRTNYNRYQPPPTWERFQGQRPQNGENRYPYSTYPPRIPERLQPRSQERYSSWGFQRKSSYATSHSESTEDDSYHGNNHNTFTTHERSLRGFKRNGNSGRTKAKDRGWNSHEPSSEKQSDSDDDSYDDDEDADD